MKRTMKQKLECIRKAVSNAKEHISSNDPRSVYSQYIRYALHEVSDLNFCTSDAAKGLKRKDVVHEHVIPHSFLMEKLVTMESLTNENILSTLQRYYIICAITKEQDKLLTASGLRSKMPDGWNESTDSVFARYEVAEISIHKST